MKGSACTKGQTHPSVLQQQGTKAPLIVVKKAAVVNMSANKDTKLHCSSRFSPSHRSPPPQLCMRVGDWMS